MSRALVRSRAALPILAAFWCLTSSTSMGAAGTPEPAPPSRARAIAPSGPVNLLLITVDTTRADHLGCYGFAKAETPVLDRLAAEGALVEQAIAVAPLTLPSHASIMTGRYPPSTGVRDNADYRLPATELTLAEHLRSRGYATSAVVASVVLERSLGLDQGFDRYDEPKRETVRSSGGSAVAYQPILKRKAADVTDAALSALDRSGGKPFFLWVHYFDPHFDYDPPAPWSVRFVGALYDGEIAYMDSQIGRLVDRLRRDGRLDRTLIVVVGDHGESLGEHGEVTHGLLLYDATLRVPFILRLPGAIPSRTRADILASGVDVAPTALGLLGLPPLPRAQGRNLSAALRDGGAMSGKGPGAREPVARTAATAEAGEGVVGSAVKEGAGSGNSSGGAVRAGAGGAGEGRAGAGSGSGAHGESRIESRQERAPVYAETLLPQRAYGWAPLFALRSKERTFIDAPEPELFDLQVDPAEMHNLSAAQPEETAAWRERMDGVRKALGEADPAARVPMDAEQLDRLRSLGYVSGGSPSGSPGSAADPKHLVAWHNAVLDAQSLISAGRLAEARTRLEAVLAADPHNPAAQSLLGMLLFAKGDRVEGLARLQGAARASPGVYQNQRNLANALQVAGRLDESARAWRVAITLRPGGGEDHYALGNVLFAQGNARGAIEEYLEALKLGPPSAGLRAALGVSYAAAGETAGARRELGRAVRDDPKLSGAWIALGRLDEGASRWEPARLNYSMALKAAPDSAEALFRYARVCLELGRVEEARRSGERLFESHPNYPAAGYLRGRLRLAAGDKDGARDALRQFLAQTGADPGLLASARSLLKTLGP